MRKKELNQKGCLPRDPGDIIASVVQPKSAIDQISKNSSLSSSPKSVLLEKVPVDQVSSWSFNPEVSSRNHPIPQRKL